jgi:hypothetical protein
MKKGVDNTFFGDQRPIKTKSQKGRRRRRTSDVGRRPTTGNRPRGELAPACFANEFLGEEVPHLKKSWMSLFFINKMDMDA